MYKAIKIELKLTKEQKIQVNKTIGTERFIYNEYIKYNQEQYELGNKFVSAFDFSKYINNVYLPSNPDKNFPLIDEFDNKYENYEKNVDFFIKNLYKEEARDFQERVLCFGNNFSTNIEDKCTKEEFNADYKVLDKIDKVFEDTFEYAKNKNIDVKNEKELKALTDEVRLNLTDKRYEELVKDEHKEKIENKKEERKVKDFFDFVDEEVKKDEREKEFE